MKRTNDFATARLSRIFGLLGAGLLATVTASPAALAQTAPPTPPVEPEPPEPPDSREPTGPHGKLAPLEFYRGGVAVEAVFGDVDLARGEAPKVALQVALVNRSGRAEQLSFGVRGGKAVPVVIEAGARITVPVDVPASHVGKGDGAQLVRLDLVLQANGALLGVPPERTDVQVRLPKGVPGLVRANRALKLSDQSPEGGVYRLTQGRGFLPDLVLAYNGGPVTLDVEKSLDPGVIRSEGAVTVKLTVRNRSREVAKNVRIFDSYDPRDFDGAGAGFKPENGKDNDQRLVWQGEIPGLAPGESQTFVLQLKAKHPVAASSLSAAMAEIDGSLVGVSNKIVLPPLDAQK